MMPLNKIMYVEDEADIREVAQLALELVGGYSLLICSSGQEAIDKAEAFAPDLILLDVMMPSMDGPMTLAKLRKFPHLIHTPVVFMTAKVQPNEVTALRNLGALEVIAKPFDPMLLATQLREIWETRHV
ncbi:MAG: response regulator [Methylococcaceae bacterium]